MVRALDKADAMRRFPALYNIGRHLPFYHLLFQFSYVKLFRFFFLPLSLGLRWMQMNKMF